MRLDAAIARGFLRVFVQLVENHTMRRALDGLDPSLRDLVVSKFRPRAPGTPNEQGRALLTLLVERLKRPEACPR